MKARLFLYLVAMILAGVLALPAFGQNPFVKTLGGNDWDIGHSVIEASDGGLVVTGETYSYGAGNFDLLLAKFDGSGTPLWTKTLGGTDDDRGQVVTEVSDGGFVVIGGTQSYGAGDWDLFLSKFDGSGNHLWTKTLGGTGHDRGYVVTEVSDGGLLLQERRTVTAQEIMISFWPSSMVRGTIFGRKLLGEAAMMLDLP